MCRNEWTEKNLTVIYADVSDTAVNKQAGEILISILKEYVSKQDGKNI